MGKEGLEKIVTNGDKEGFKLYYFCGSVTFEWPPMIVTVIIRR